MLRLAELLGSFTLATDLTDGFPLEKSLRTTILATRLARAVTSSPAEHELTFWSTLLRFTGCTAFAHEEATHYSAGDDLSLRKTLAYTDLGRPTQFVARAVREIARDAPFLDRARALGNLLTSRAPRWHAEAQCEAGADFASSVGLPEVAQVLRFQTERWDGRGPRGAGAGTDLPLAHRLSDVADVAELFGWLGGPARALEELRRRRGGQLDPDLVDRFSRDAPALFEGLWTPSVWELFLAHEPSPRQAVADEARRTACLEAFGRFADLSSVYTLGHAAAVSELAHQAALGLGLDGGTAGLVRDAGLLHDLGRVAVPVGIWEKRGTLSAVERLRIASHSQHTETILRLCPALRPVADLAGQAHERGGGGGYHRGLPGGPPSAAGMVLAAADVAVALRSARPHRPALTGPEQERTLRELAREGALDGRAVSAVLEGLGVARRRVRSPALSPRELQVARLVAVGRSNREIGTLLGISGRTAQKHVMHIYDKLGVESRAGLALMAMRLGWLED